MGAIYPDQNAEVPNFVTPSGVEPYEPKPQTFGAKAADAFLINNDVVNLYRRMNEQQYPADPSHNPKEMLAGTHYWDNFSDSFISSRSEPETRSIMRRIDEEEAAKQRSAESGPMGTALDLAAGIASPTVFLPAGQILRSARGGYSAIKSAASIGIAGGVQTAAQEAVLQGSQETRTLHESLINVGSGTLLAGILGAGGSKLLQHFETSQAEAAVARARLQIDAHNGVDILNTPPTEGFDVVHATPPQAAAQPSFDTLHASPYHFTEFDLSKSLTGQGSATYGLGINLAEAKGAHDAYLREFSSHPAAGPEGSVSYRVRVHADRDHLLDLDAPLGGQSDYVKAALDRFKSDYPSAFDEFSENFPNMDHRRSHETSMRLNEVGIPGSKYLDQKSRNLTKDYDVSFVDDMIKRNKTDLGKTRDPSEISSIKSEIVRLEAQRREIINPSNPPKQTRNFVIFDDKLLTIIEKNGEKIDVRPFTPEDRAAQERIAAGGDASWLTNPKGAESNGSMGSVGAASMDNRQLEMAGGPVLKAVLENTKRTSPTRTLAYSSSVEARKIAADLASDPYVRAENIPTDTSPAVATTQGPPVDIQTRMAIDGTEYQIGAAMKQHYADYRFGDATKRTPVLRDRYERMTAGTDKLSYDDFKKEVGKAWMNMGTHDIPQASAAAMAIMEKVEHWAQRADQSVEGFKRAVQATGEAYFPHLWNKELIKGQKPEFTNWLTGIYKADQRVKQAAQERIGSFHGALESHQGNIDKLTAKIAKLSEDAEVVEARAEEATRVNKFANQRATALREGGGQHFDAFHGSPHDVKAFDPSRIGTGDGDSSEGWGFYLSSSSESAGEYRKAGTTTDYEPSGEGNLYSVKVHADRTHLLDWEKPLEQQSEHVKLALSPFFDSGIASKGSSTGEDIYDQLVQSFGGRKLASESLAAHGIPGITYIEQGRHAESIPNFVIFDHKLLEITHQNGAPFRLHKNLDKARGGAVFETKVRTRGNELADRLSGKLAAIDDLEQKLAKEIASHDEMRAKIEDELGKWEGTSASEAKSAMKARQKAEDDRIARAAAKGEAPPTKRLTSADDAIDRAVKRIMESDRNRTDAELRSRAAETTDRIIGSPDGRLPYDEHMGGPQIGKTSAVANRGALAHRRLEVTNAQAAPWIEQDAEHVLASYMRTVVPDVLLSEKFGDPEMTVAFKRINEDYNKLIDPTKPGRERDRLTNERDNAIKVTAAIRDRIRGVYGWSENTSNMARVANSVKVLNNISDLGTSAIASLSDFAGPLFRWGITAAIRDGWAPFFQALSTKGEEGRQFMGQMRAIGIGIDVATNARQHAMDEITGAYRPGSPIERTLQTVNDKFFIANLLAPLTDMQKMIASHAAVHEIVNVSRRISEGKATAREAGNMAGAGIDAQMAERIWREFSKPGNGDVVGKVYLPNTATWADRAAADAFNGAVYREVNIAVVSPGQEKPLFLSRPVGSLLGQFKTFTAAANERILVANLQRRDAQSLSGVVAAIGLGMLSYKINSLTGGQPTSDRPADWFREGVSRSGMLGWLEEGNAALAKATGGKADIYRLAGSDKPLTRYAGRNTLDMVLGPTVGKARDLLSLPGPLFRGDWSAADTHQVRRIMPFENMFYLRGLFNKVEETTNSHFGIPERRERAVH